MTSWRPCLWLVTIIFFSSGSYLYFFYLVCAQDGLCPLKLRVRFRFLGYRRRLDRKIMIIKINKTEREVQEIRKRADGVTPLLRASVL